MDGNKLTLSNCLRFLADNMDNEGKCYLRVGAVLLEYDCERDEYVVYEKDGKSESFVDLIMAINHFISAVLYL